MSDARSTNGDVGATGDDEIELREILAVVRRRWWLLPLFAMLFVAGAWLYTQSKAPLYTAEVLLRKDQQRSPLQVFPTALGAGPGPRAVATQIQLIQSRAVLEPVVDSLGLRLAFGDPVQRTRVLGGLQIEPEAPMAGYVLVADGGGLVLRADETGARISRARAGKWLRGPGFRLRVGADSAWDGELPFSLLFMEPAIERLRERLRVDAVGETTLIRAAYTDPDPRLASAVLNTLAASYRSYSARHERQQAIRRREFLAGQLRAIQDSLHDARREVLRHKQRTGTLSPAVEGRVLLEALVKAEEQYRTMRYNEEILQQITRLLGTDGRSDEALRRAVVLGKELVPTIDALYAHLQELQTERSRMLSNPFGYTKDAARVEVLDSLIVETEREMEALVQQSLRALEARRGAAAQRVNELRAQVGGLPARSTELARRTQQVEAIQNRYTLLAEAYYEAKVAAAVEMGKIEIIDRAVVPALPDPSNTRMVLLLALVFGLIMGTGGAFVLEYMDTNVRGSEDAERASGLEVIASIPLVQASTNGKGPAERPIVVEHANPAGEAIRTLRTMLRFASTEPPQVVAVTSALPGDGKSFVSSNLAVALAQQEPRVLLVDADLRRSLVHHVFHGQGLEPGLSNVLVGEASLEEAIQGSPDNRVNVLHSGTLVPNPAELLDSRAFADFMAHARRTYDAIVVDTPPALLVTDAMLLAPKVDGMLVVTRAEQTDRDALAQAVQQLRHVDAPLLGMVLNGVARGSHYGSYGEYYYHQNGGKDAGGGRLERVKRALQRVT